MKQTTTNDKQSANKMALPAIVAFSIAVGALGNHVLAQMKGPTDMKGVSVTELGIINDESLTAQLGIEGFILRMRAVTVEAGGHIMEHSHADSPGLVYMVNGEWVEGRPEGETLYVAGEDRTMPEDKDTVHWVYNRGEDSATAIVCGIQPSS